MATIVNAVMNGITGAVFAALSPFSPAVVLLIISGLSAAGSLLVFRKTSEQERIRVSKGRMKAHLLGVLIFRHDLRQMRKRVFLLIIQLIHQTPFLRSHIERSSRPPQRSVHRTIVQTPSRRPASNGLRQIGFEILRDRLPAPVITTKGFLVMNGRNAM